MAVIKFKAEENKGFAYEEGTYIGEITAIEPKTSNTKKRYYQFTLKGEGFTQIFVNIFDNKFGRADLYSIYTAIGIDPKREDIEDVEILDNYLQFDIVESGEYEKDGKTYKNYSPQNFRAIESADTEDEASDDDEW